MTNHTDILIFHLSSCFLEDTMIKKIVSSDGKKISIIFQETRKIEESLRTTILNFFMMILIK